MNLNGNSPQKTNHNESIVTGLCGKLKLDNRSCRMCIVIQETSVSSRHACSARTSRFRRCGIMPRHQHRLGSFLFVFVPLDKSPRVHSRIMHVSHGYDKALFTWIYRRLPV
jgi:hypothetical protein